MKVLNALKLAGLAGSLLFSSLSFASAVNLGENDVAIHNSRREFSLFLTSQNRYEILQRRLRVNQRLDRDFCPCLH